MTQTKTLFATAARLVGAVVAPLVVWALPLDDAYA